MDVLQHDDVAQSADAKLLACPVNGIREDLLDGAVAEELQATGTREGQEVDVPGLVMASKLA